MQIIRSFEQGDATAIGFGVRVLVLSSEGADGQISHRLARLGGKVDVVEELFAALSELIDDPAGYGLFVVDCDSAGVGGLEAAQRAVQMLGAVAQRVPVILVSGEVHDHSFPPDRSCPTILRAPVSAVSLKVGFEHALRERLFNRAA